MRTVHDFFKSAIAMNLVSGTDDPDIYYTPAALRMRSRAVASEPGDLNAIMAGSDFLYGTYSRLKALKRREQRRAPGTWTDTDIHHIVENHHLQFLGRVYPVDDDTYGNLEPCVLFLRSQHNLVLNGAIEDATNYVLESKRFNFVEEFDRAHKGSRLCDMSRGQMTLMKVGWLRDVVAQKKVTLREVREWLVEVYREVYQEADMRPLREISESVLRGMPV
jgi:hypothetical protein